MSNTTNPQIEPQLIFDSQEPQRLSEMPATHPVVQAIVAIASNVNQGMANQTLQQASQQAAIAAKINVQSQTNANNAGASATTAGQQASNAAASATTAGQQATNAAASATTAGQQAGNAASSATSAGQQATNAAASATTASQQATNAATNATNAALSATAANTSVGNAQTAASQAIAAAHAYTTTAAALADSTLAVNASFSVPLADGTLQAYTKTSSTVATAIGLPFLSNGSAVAPNVLFDEFNEFSYANPLLGAWNWYASGIPTFTLASTNLPLTTPVAQASGAAAIYKYWDPLQGGIKVGDAIRVAVYAWFQNTGGRATLYFRDSSNNVLGTAVVVNAAGTGINTILLTGTVPASTYSISVRVDNPTSGGSFEWGATFASIGVANPAFVRGPAPRLYVESDSSGPNMLFDSFNEYSSIDPLFAEWPWWPTLPTFTSASVNIPLTTPVAQGSGTTNLDKKFKFGATRFKAGDKATFAVLAWFAAAGATVSVFFRDASNTVLASAVLSSRPAGLQTVYAPVTVPSGAIDHILIRVVQTVAASAFEVGGYFAAVDQRPALVRSVPAKTYLEAALTGPNILFDAYNEFSSVNLRFGGWTQWWSATPPTFSTSSANIPVATPVVIGTPGQNVDKTYDFSTLGLKAGDSVTVGVLCYFANAGASISVSYRDSSGNVLQNTAGQTLAAGLQMAYLTTAVPTGAIARLAIRVTPPAGGAFEAAGYFAAIGQKPNRNTAPCPSKYNSLLRRQKNMMPDPFLRLANDGILVDGHVVSDVAATSIVTTANSPFRAQLAVLIPSGSGSVNRNVAVKRLHLKAGDTLLTKVGLYGNQTVTVGAFLRGADGTVYSNNSASVTLANSYGEALVFTTITQTMVANADYLQIRTLSGQTAGASGVYVCGFGAYVGTEDVVLSDDTFDADDAQVGIQRAKHYRAGEQYVREARMRLTKLGFATAAQLVIGAIGDSWTHNADRWSGVFANWIVGPYGDAGGGYTGFASGGGSYDNGNARYALYGYSRTGTWDATNYTASVMAGIGQMTSATAGSKITCTGPAGPVLNAANLQWVGTADGVLQYRWNGGAWTNVNTQGTVGNVGITNLSTNMPVNGAAFTLDIAVVSGTVTLGGVDFQSAANGVRFHKLGATGSLAQQWAVQAAGAQWQAAIAALGINLFTVMLATNDQNGRTTAQYAADLATIITGIRAAAPLADILVMMPAENQRNNAIPMARYTAVAYDVAAQFHCGFLDLQYLYGDKPFDYANIADNPNGRNWFTSIASDGGIHPNVATNGGYPIVDAVRRFLLDS